MQFIKIFDKLMSEVLSLYWIKLLKLEKNYLVTNRITSVYKLPQMHTSPLRIQRSLIWVQQTAVAFSFLSINCFCSYFLFLFQVINTQNLKCIFYEIARKRFSSQIAEFFEVQVLKCFLYLFGDTVWIMWEIEACCSF